MKCLNCDTDYSNSNQLICEHCGSELAKEKKPIESRPSSKIDRFLDETGLKDLYQKLKKSLKE